MSSAVYSALGACRASRSRRTGFTSAFPMCWMARGNSHVAQLAMTFSRNRITSPLNPMYMPNRSRSSVPMTM